MANLRAVITQRENIFFFFRNVIAIYIKFSSCYKNRIISNLKNLNRLNFKSALAPREPIFVGREGGGGGGGGGGGRKLDHIKVSKVQSERGENL